MKLVLKCSITDENVFVPGSSCEVLENFYDAGRTEIRWKNDSILFSIDIVVSQKVLGIIDAANKSCGEKEREGYTAEWCRTVYRGLAKKELMNPMRALHAGADAFLRELKSSLNIGGNPFSIGNEINVVDEDNKVYKLVTPMSLHALVELSLKINDSHFNLFLKDFKAGANLFGLTILNNSKSHNNPNQRLIEIAVAAELGIKEFYAKRYPDAYFIISKLQSPAISVLYGAAYENYVGNIFPYAKELDKLFAARNKLVHTNNHSVSMQEVLRYSTVVQASLATLMIELSGPNDLVNNLLDFGKLEDRGFNQAQYVLSKSQNAAISENRAMLKSDLTTVFSD